ncbi:hypothetical protein K9B33_22455 [Sphingobium sp. 3R8]|uniref:hypothetical protein n=1 Tax=Sphingobium sp. 3R8 TaxID=2874921 RepID=UPI001CCCB18C|nr:hypothetical protein [Sphingobium sp. 3R8]MBZ9650297.1 hypothetical protein [Sphingobium sp. 3R8]
MFDHIYCEIPLPDGFTGKMQTKDFDCLFATLLIRADGRLMIEDCEWEDVPLEERPNPEFPLLGARRAINKRWRDLDFHGDFRFCGAREPGGQWHEYGVRFTHGALESIHVIEEAYPPLTVSAELKAVPMTATDEIGTEAGSMIAEPREGLTLGRKLDSILTALPADRRRIVESRAVELITEAMRELSI